MEHQEPTQEPTHEDVRRALDTIRIAAKRAGIPWALIGGQALRAYGVPRITLDADLLAPAEAEAFADLADVLIADHGWTPLDWDDATGDYVVAEQVVIQVMDDPVLFDMGQQRKMIPLLTPDDLTVEILAAQHPVEEDMITGSVHRTYNAVQVPLAPLGGVLLVKRKAARKKDDAAIEQTAEHLKAPQLAEALAWARRRDPATAEELQADFDRVRLRRKPNRRIVRNKKGR